MNFKTSIFVFDNSKIVTFQNHARIPDPYSQSRKMFVFENYLRLDRRRRSWHFKALRLREEDARKGSVRKDVRKGVRQGVKNQQVSHLLISLSLSVYMYIYIYIHICIYIYV